MNTGPINEQHTILYGSPNPVPSAHHQGAQLYRNMYSLKINICHGEGGTEQRRNAEEQYLNLTNRWRCGYSIHLVLLHNEWSPRLPFLFCYKHEAETIAGHCEAQSLCHAAMKLKCVASGKIVHWSLNGLISQRL